MIRLWAGRPLLLHNVFWAFRPVQFLGRKGLIELDTIAAVGQGSTAENILDRYPGPFLFGGALRRMCLPHPSQRVGIVEGPVLA